MPTWLTLSHEEPIALVRGAGCRVWDSEGREYLDFFGGLAATISGHSVPEVITAIRTQAGKLIHSSTLYLIEPAIDLAERICELSPIPDSKVFFVTSGSEANEAALLMATSYRRSDQVLALRNSYHGRSFATVAVTGNSAWTPSNLSPFVVRYMQDGYRYRSPYRDLSDSEFVDACVRDLRYAIETETAGDVACLIAEPIQGVGGVIVPPDGFFAGLKSVLDEHGILLISDEVQTGFGRTGEHLWGIEAHGVIPDLMTFAKGLGNGLSIGGVVGRGEVVDSIQARSISTFGGNPLSSAGALANINYLLDNGLPSNAHAVGARLISLLRGTAASFPFVAEVRGKGLLVGVELAEPDGRAPMPAAAATVMDECKRRGLLIGCGGLYGNVLRLSPPLSLTREEADHGSEILAAALAAYDG